MNILVTGANGFVGKNLIATLEQMEEHKVLKVTRQTTTEELNDYAQLADFVFHLAGVNRPEKDEEFVEGNVDFTQTLLNALIKAKNKAPILITSSTQATNDSAYGQSKKAGEDLVFQYGKDYSVKTYVYRLPNLFGKWSKPNYNTVIATFSHKIARGEEITINDPEVELSLVYIDDLVEEFLKALEGKLTRTGDYCEVPVVYTEKLGHIADLLKEFRESRTNRVISNLDDDFTRKLYSTYLNFLPVDGFSYPLVMHEDPRGSFTEFVKSPYAGQVSVNVSKPGITKGEHWHHTKNEKFLVVSGSGVIRFRDYFSDEVIEYKVSGGKLEVVDIPTGYTHSIVNTGDNDMVTVMWVNEMFDPNNPDTFFLEV
ncbi:NAD-dependent epimerase/dehydratase family protein [Aerococcus urinaeequi]|uniref:NAD-dependent epimerase/dehydratase family protein n=1 Tax=Aerococcus urinaeequi TaxID=51665 RepID=A0A7M1KQN3_9LACT|nr:NAD-dependent epimerase/dehydratase family protein [Aerococcus urinaeequi]QOQ78651.1 NAD-dependent epimerase/dehydratase family protein [Aerococcus urinaeequi]